MCTHILVWRSCPDCCTREASAAASSLTAAQVQSPREARLE